jgi:hypothetical protein
LRAGLKPDEFWNMTFFEWSCFQNGLLERDQTRWNHTGAVMAMLFNINRGRGQSAKSANDFNPYAKGMASPEQNKPMTADDVKALADEMKQHGRKK